MASPPNSRTHRDGVAAATDSSVAFALQELIACWSQAHEAMGCGDLNLVGDLLDQADSQLASAGDGTGDTPEEAALRQRAVTAYALLQHAMKSGLDGIQKELGHTHRGKRALRGYVQAAGRVDGRLIKSV